MLIFERKIFRRIYGAKYGNGEWKSETNRELEETSEWQNIVKWTKGQKISWLGHLERMAEDRMTKKIFTEELERTRRRARPRERWKEEVERDLQVLGVRRWRESWWQIGKNGRTSFDRPKPTVGCSANGRRRYLCVPQALRLRLSTFSYRLYLVFFLWLSEKNEMGWACGTYGWGEGVYRVLVGIPWNVGNFLTSCKPVSFSRRTLHHAVSKYDYWNKQLLIGSLFSAWLLQCVVCVWTYPDVSKEYSVFILVVFF